MELSYMCLFHHECCDSFVKDIFLNSTSIILTPRFRLWILISNTKPPPNKKRKREIKIDNIRPFFMQPQSVPSVYWTRHAVWPMHGHVAATILTVFALWFMKKSRQVCRVELPIQSKIHHKRRHHASQVDSSPGEIKRSTFFSNFFQDNYRISLPVVQSVQTSVK